MTFTAVKPEAVINTGLGLLYRQMVIPQLITTWGIDRFVGAKGDTVNVKLPAVATARRQALRATGAARTIVVDDLAQTSFPVVLDERVYHAAGIPDETETLDELNFMSDVCEPQVKAIAEDLEDIAIEGMAAATYAVTGTVLDVGDPQVTFNLLNKILNNAFVPRSERVIVVGSDIEEALLNDEKFQRADIMGGVDDSAAALKDAALRRAAKFSIYGSSALGPKQGYAFHRSAFILAAAAPVVPVGQTGATMSTGSADGSFALRWMTDYDKDQNMNRSIFTAFAGFGVVPATTGTNSGKVVRAVPFTMA